MLDPQRAADLLASDAALVASMFPLAANDRPVMRPFLVQIKDGAEVVLEFGACGPDSITVAQQHECLCEGRQVVRVLPASAAVSFPVAAARLHVETVQMREAAKNAADREEDRNKAARRHAVNDRAALDLQLNRAGVR